MRCRVHTLGLVGLLATAEFGCVLVDNPNYLALDGESETEGESSSSSETTSESTTSESTTSETTTSDTTETTMGSDCPPGKFGELDCPCVDGLTCDLGLTCVDGVCIEPTNCPAEDPNVVVAIDLLANGPSPATRSDFCDLEITVEGQGTLTNCNLGDLSDILFSLGPSASVDGLVGSSATSVTLSAVAAEELFLRIQSFNGFVLWLVVASSFVPADPELSNFPLSLAPAGSDCPYVPEFCGASQRRAVLVGDQAMFDGSSATVGGFPVWVDEARSVCGSDRYRVALLSQ